MIIQLLVKQILAPVPFTIFWTDFRSEAEVQSCIDAIMIIVTLLFQMEITKITVK